MKLKKLLQPLSINLVKGNKDVEITGITSDSRLVAPGNLFIAKRGSTEDGARYIPQAIQGGAVAIATDLYDPSLKGVTQIIDTDIRALEAELAAEFYAHPSKRLFMVGVTGTNGKTTTASLIQHLLTHLGKPCGIIGTGKQRIPLTTPDIISNQKLLREMILSGHQAAVMEVTSHALDQGRCASIQFDVGVFTNLSLDHLDYHPTMEAYAAAKAKLFTSVPQAVINADDPWHTRLNLPEKVVTYGKSGQLAPENLELKPDHTSFTIQGIPFTIPYIGTYNVYNTLAAIGVGRIVGASLDKIATILRTAPQIPGRLERVLGTPAIVDFAHTPDALREVLIALRDIACAKLITVFGCGGDRDPTKRPEMYAIAKELSDEVIVTSDNPRSEDPKAICQGITQEGLIIVDRKEAIGYALERAGPQDLVLIAGKGHETEQIFAHHRVPFDDRIVAKTLWEQLCAK